MEDLDLVSMCCRAHVSRTLHGETPYRCATCGKEGDAVRPDRSPGPGPHQLGEATREHRAVVQA